LHPKKKKKKQQQQQQQKRGPKSKPQGQNPNMVTNGEWNKYVLKHPLVKIYISKKEMKETKRAVRLKNLHLQ
jgi:hypothetical protein